MMIRQLIRNADELSVPQFRKPRDPHRRPKAQNALALVLVPTGECALLQVEIIMFETVVNSLKRLVDPVSRISEVLFGLIMVLTFTCSLSAGESGHSQIHEMLVGAIGCNLAWGLVDAVMFLMTSLTVRGHGLSTMKAVRKATTPKEAHNVIAEALPPVVASLMNEEELEGLRVRLNNLPEPPLRPWLAKDDVLGAVAVFFLVFLSTFPVVLPFLFMKDPGVALRVSNGIAIAMLFLTGYSLGRYADAYPWRTGFVMVLLGFALVGITIALGG